MTEQQQKLRDLLERHTAQTATEDQRNELFTMVNNASDAELEGALTGMLESTEPDFNEGRRERLLGQILHFVQDDKEQNGKRAKVRTMFPFRRVAAAAVIVLMLSVGGYFYFNNKSQDKIEVARVNDVVAPKATKAMITLGNGQTVPLDSIANGTLVTQGNVKVIKTADGKIVYSGDASEVAYNTLSNPQGSHVVDIILADGSHVWLNAGSTITYPIAFIEKDRKISITGEAYFKVAHDAGKPFKVVANGMEVQALGTEFNVNSYSDESVITATLIEGSVKVSKDAANTILNPGQQTQLSADGKLAKRKVANMEEVTGWKEGYFHFESADLKTILRQFARWYDVNVIYEQEPGSRKFFCVVNRNSTLSKVLKLLQSNDIKFRIEGRNLHVIKG